MRAVVLMVHAVVMGWGHTEMAVAVPGTSGLLAHSAILLARIRHSVLTGLFLLPILLLLEHRLVLSECRNFHRILCLRRAVRYILDIAWFAPSSAFRARRPCIIGTTFAITLHRRGRPTPTQPPTLIRSSCLDLTDNFCNLLLRLRT